MNKINNKGFMMAEIIVVAVVVVIGLVGLFTTFTRTFLEYERYNEYSQVDSLYASKSVVNNLGIADIETVLGAEHYKSYSTVENDTIKELFNDYNIKTFYLVQYSKDSFDNLISSLTNNEEFKQYVNYLKNNLDFDDGSCKVISILEMKSDSSTNKNQFGYYKFVKSSGTAEGGGVGTTNNPPNKPDIDGTGLVPVVYDEDNKKWKIVKKDDLDWYNYDEQKWANAVILKNKSKNADTDPYIEVDILNTTNGDTESELDIYAMFVWIPRFSYTIGCKNNSCLGYKINGASDLSQDTPGAIDIKFVEKNFEKEIYIGKSPTYTYVNDSSRNPTNYYTHPAFTFGTYELSGIWVGKFETSVNPNSTCYSNLSIVSTSASSNCRASNEDVLPRILPNVVSLTNQTVLNQFKTASKFNFDLYGIFGDAHMMKNSEWSAVAYLSQSKYGKYGNAYYSGVNREIYLNNYGTYIAPNFTGVSAGSKTASYTDVVAYRYDNIENRDDVSGAAGAGASTTGNIYGVYDMNGGAVDRVMGNYGKVTNGIFSGKISGGDLDVSKYESFYYNKFTIVNPFIKSEDGDEITGQALCEVAGWYGDKANTFSDTYSWLVRGGSFSGGDTAGVFNGATDFGGAYEHYGFHTVFVKNSY